MQSLELITPPYAEPIHLDEAKAACKVEVVEDDSLLRRLIRGVRRWAEGFCQKQLVVATWKLYLDDFPGCLAADDDDDCSGMIVVPLPPLVSVDSITYTANAATQTVAAADYQVDAIRQPGRIVHDSTWPAVDADTLNAVQVTFKAGWLLPFTAATTDVCTAQGRNLTNGTKVRLTNSGGELPPPLVTDTDYFVVEASGATFKLSLTSGGAAIDITGTGRGTHFVGELPGVIRDAMLDRLVWRYVHRGDDGAQPPEPDALWQEWSGAY